MNKRINVRRGTAPRQGRQLTAALAVACLALVWGGAAAQAAEPAQQVSAAAVRQLIQQQTEAALGEPVELLDHRALPEINLPAGQLELALRFPHATGQWLPGSLEARVDGRLITALALAQYLDFKLPVLVARAGLAQGALVDPALLETKTVTLAPGQEVLTSAGLADGLQARSFFGPGMRLKLSRLVPPTLVKRGAAVTLMLHAAGVQLSAQGTALADAYAGQALSVRRESDGRILRGVVRAADSGAVVDVE